MANTPSDVRIHRLARFYCAPDWSWEARGSSAWTGETPRRVRFNYDLWTVLQGRGALRAPHGTFVLGAGDCFILRGDERYAGRHDPADPLVVFAVHYDYLDARGRVVRPPTRLHRRLRRLDFFSALLDRMEAAWLEGEGGRERAHLWLRACLAEIQGQDRLGVVRGRRRRVVEEVEKICREIVQDPGRDWPAGALAARLYCTPDHFGRLFKGVKGVSPRDFIGGARVERAKGLLHASDYPLKRIAEMSGFRDIFFFSRHFKKKTGLSPTAYRGHGAARPHPMGSWTMDSQRGRAATKKDCCGGCRALIH